MSIIDDVTARMDANAKTPVYDLAPQFALQLHKRVYERAAPQRYEIPLHGGIVFAYPIRARRIRCENILGQTFGVYDENGRLVLQEDAS